MNVCSISQNTQTIPVSHNKNNNNTMQMYIHFNIHITHIHYTQAHPILSAQHFIESKYRPKIRPTVIANAMIIDKAA